MQQLVTKLAFRARHLRPTGAATSALSALAVPATVAIIAFVGVPAAAAQSKDAAQASAQTSPQVKTSGAAQPRTVRATGSASTNKPVDATQTGASPDPTPTQIGTGGVVELTSIDGEAEPARDTVVIPTELEPGTSIPPTRTTTTRTTAANRAATPGRPLGAAPDAASAGVAAGRPLSGASEGGSPFMDQVVPTALALAGTIAAIFAARFLARRFGGKFFGGALGGAKRPSGVVEVLARYPFARGHHIVLIKVGRRVLVTHQSAQGIQTLSEFSSPAEVADIIARCEAGARGTEQFSFDSLLRSSDRDFDAPAPALGERRGSQRVQRPEGRAGLPASVRSAEIETIDLTRRRGVAR